MEEIIKIFKEIEKNDGAYRFEFDDSGYHLSIIDRSVYPRVWIDNVSAGNVNIIEESTENFINRELPVLKKDWKERYEGETIEELVFDYKNSN